VELGNCSICLGSRDAFALQTDEPTLLCDGEGCTKEFHLGCLLPKITKIPENEIFCEDCSIEGSSSCLMSYFLEADEIKQRCGGSYYYVLGMLKKLNCSGLSSELDYYEDWQRRIESNLDVSNSVEDSSSKNEEEEEEKEEEEEEEEEINNNQSGSGGKTLKKPSTTTTTTTPPSLIMSKNIDTSTVSGAAFIGQTIRLYCPIGEQYHTGRILDWRKAIMPLFSIDPIHHNDTTALTSTKKQQGNFNIFYGIGNASGCEFLVRFRAGGAGRKIPVHRWIVLEEHSVSVGNSVVWGKAESFPWWPGQVLSRSALEIAHMKKVGNELDDIREKEEKKLLQREKKEKELQQKEKELEQKEKELQQKEKEKEKEKELQQKEKESEMDVELGVEVEWELVDINLTKEKSPKPPEKKMHPNKASSNKNTGFTLFFGEEAQDQLKLATNVAPFLSPNFETNRLRTQEKSISISCAMAEIELEEQRRCKKWMAEHNKEGGGGRG